MKKIIFNDGLLSRSRRPHLFFAKGAKIVKFKGDSIPGICAITKSNYKQCGKWSNTDYELAIADDVTIVNMCEPFEGWGCTFEDLREGFSSDEENFSFTDEFLSFVGLNLIKGMFRRSVEEAIQNKKMLSSLEPQIEDEKQEDCSSFDNIGIDFDFSKLAIETKVLWFSRHEMSKEQLQDLKRIYGKNIIINQVSKTIKSAYELQAEIEENDVIAIVAPINLQQQFLKLAGNKPVIMSTSERIIEKQEDGSEEKVIFKFKNWHQLIKIDVVMNCL